MHRRKHTDSASRQKIVHEIKTLRKHQKTSTSRALRCDDTPPHPRVDTSTLAKVGGASTQRTCHVTLGRLPMRLERRPTARGSTASACPLQNRRSWRQVSSPPPQSWQICVLGTTPRPTRRVRRARLPTADTAPGRTPRPSSGRPML